MQCKIDDTKFDYEGFALVRKLDGIDEQGKIRTKEENGRKKEDVILTMEPAQNVPTSCTVYDKDGKVIVTAADIAELHGKTFSAKQDWFREQCLKLRTSWEDEHTFIFIRRTHLIEDSVLGIMMLEPHQLRNMFRFEFIGEPGIDAGGVAREWFEVVSQQLFHPDAGLWQYSAVNQMCMQINASSGLANENHLHYFRFTGRFLGKALFDGQLVASHLIRHIYKHMLGWPLMFADIEMIDDNVFRSLMMLGDIEDVEDLCLDFSVMESEMGMNRTVDLIPDGADVDVTNDNLKLFLEKSLEYRINTRVQAQLKQLLLGFYEVMPEALLTVFDFQELELMCCGLPHFDLEDWKVNTEYLGQYESKKTAHKVVAWFWEVVEEWDEELKARLMQFVTGTSGVPAQGFAYLQGNDGNIRKFAINSISKSSSLYPRAHTCFNRIDLPLYDSKQELHDKVKLAVQMEATGFDIE